MFKCCTYPAHGRSAYATPFPYVAPDSLDGVESDRFPIRLLPALHNWRMRRRILYWYKELKNLENDLPKSAGPDLIEKKELELERIEEGVRRISVPIQFVADLYNLRDHVEFVRRRIELLAGHHVKSLLQPALSELE